MSAAAPGRTRVIVNPSIAGAELRLARVRPLLEAAWPAADWCVSQGAQHLEALCRSAAEEGFARAVVAGGDGSLHLAIRGLAHSRTALGILPLGTGNDFAAAAGIPLDLEAAARVLIAGHTEVADLGTAGGIPFCCIAGVGMDTPALDFIEGSRIRPRKLLYQVAAVRTLLSYEAPRVRITAAGAAIEERVVFAAVANTPTYAGGNSIAPSASIFDGQLGYCVFGDQPRLQRLLTFMRVKSGGHVGRPGVRTGTASRVRIEAQPPLAVTLDGERSPLRTPVDIGVLPRALQLICPPRP